MGSQFDLITPVVILGILMLLVVGLQQFMQTSSAETRFINRNQAEIGIAMQVMQEELKGLTSVIAINDSVFRYTTATNDTVRVFRLSARLAVLRNGDTLFYDVGLTDIQFNLISDSGEAPFFLRLRLDAENAATQREFYLRNLE